MGLLGLFLLAEKIVAVVRRRYENSKGNIIDY